MFAALNTMRFAIMKKLDLDTFELSQNYTLFYDKLEKANYFLESILDTLEEPTNGRVIAHLLMAPLNDGGQWDMFCNLIEKYGVVPKDAMPETACSSATREMAGYMTRKLREFACTLRTGHQNGPVPGGAAPGEGRHAGHHLQHAVRVPWASLPRPSPWRCATRTRRSSATRA